ncbi:TIGR03943 family protein [Streptomyces griseoluteus]|uniref:TIGR03943 family protein n=1 Tax=Streptomyces griseoluteus TaxID=29306 RepID=A0A4Z1DJT1_STRGP|nr:TIGR03943 family protein [Streptomyces griseoluteus]TGN83929.1 TIGR03943 family protein [Streptomyces griseoluteus]GHF06417.1 membrane protein [Streptomyces griseoluteus]
MRRLAQTALLALIGAGLLHTALFTDLYLRYVKEGLRPALIASGVALLLLGAVNACLDLRGNREPQEGHDHHEAHSHGHDHSTAPKVAWLLALPALSLLLYAPPALGAYTAAHSNGKPVATSPKERFPALPATSPLPLTLTGFTQRVQQDPTLAIRGRQVQLTGFVTPAGAGGGWYLTRIIFTCCAADSQTVKVRVHGSDAPPANTWLAVTGTWHPAGRLGTKTAEAALDVREVHPIAQPVNAYTDDLPLTPS